MKTLLISMSCLALLFLNSCRKPAISSNVYLKTKATVESQNYVFNAFTMQPLSGRSVMVNGNYSVQITPDKITVDLPYTGSSYIGGAYSQDAGLHFESSDFSYKIVEAKNGSWNIEILFNKEPSARKMFLSVQLEGNAYLKVVPMNKEAIAFNGKIGAIISKK